MIRDTGWFKSSFSGTANDNCVEVRLADPGWVKSSFSTGGNNMCVEVRTSRISVGVRDSKSPTAGSLCFAGPGWRRFLAQSLSEAS